MYRDVLRCVVVCCDVLSCVVVCRDVMRCVVVSRDVLRCVVVCRGRSFLWREVILFVDLCIVLCSVAV